MTLPTDSFLWWQSSYSFFGDSLPTDFPLVTVFLLFFWWQSSYSFIWWQSSYWLFPLVTVFLLFLWWQSSYSFVWWQSSYSFIWWQSSYWLFPLVTVFLLTLPFGDPLSTDFTLVTLFLQFPQVDYNFFLSMAACTFVWPDRSLRYSSMLLGHYATFLWRYCSYCFVLWHFLLTLVFDDTSDWSCCLVTLSKTICFSDCLSTRRISLQLAFPCSSSVFDVMVVLTRCSLLWVPHTWMSGTNLLQTHRAWLWGTHKWDIFAAWLGGVVSRIAGNVLVFGRLLHRGIE